MDIEFGRQVLRAEAQAILSLVDRIGKPFEEAARAIFECTGQVVATGMGKPGFVARKISATLASLGTRSTYLHPAEAYHGDLGRIQADDIVLAFSNSGETVELVRLLPRIRQIGARVFAITASETSTLGREADIVLTIGRIEEPCPLRLAPSASTTAMLALGDALALVVLKQRGWDEAKYAFFHPGGTLGNRLKKVREVMRGGERNPVVPEDATVRQAIGEITRRRAGAISVVDSNGRLTGIFTDGDLRRALARDSRLLERKIREVMTRKPVTIGPDRSAVEAASILGSHKIDELPVVDGAGVPIGMLDVQDLLELGLLGPER